MSTMWIPQTALDNETRLLALSVLQQRELGHGGYDIRTNAAPVENLVSRNMVCNQPETRSKRFGLATCPGVGQLPNGMDLVAQVATHDGEAGSRPT